jgi:hypothetical protein
MEAVAAGVEEVAGMAAAGTEAGMVVVVGEADGTAEAGTVEVGGAGRVIIPTGAGLVIIPTGAGAATAAMAMAGMLRRLWLWPVWLRPLRLRPLRLRPLRLRPLPLKQWYREDPQSALALGVDERRRRRGQRESTHNFTSEKRAGQKDVGSHYLFATSSDFLCSRVRRHALGLGDIRGIFTALPLLQEID